MKHATVQKQCGFTTKKAEGFTSVLWSFSWLFAVSATGGLKTTEKMLERKNGSSIDWETYEDR